MLWCCGVVMRWCGGAVVVWVVSCYCAAFAVREAEVGGGCDELRCVGLAAVDDDSVAPRGAGVRVLGVRACGC